MELPKNGEYYDAIAGLGFGSLYRLSVSDLIPGEFVIRVGEWSLDDLYAMEDISRFMKPQKYFGTYEQRRLEPGIYRVRCPILHTNDKDLDEQRALLLPNEKPIPLALCVTLLIGDFINTGIRRFSGESIRCAEMCTDRCCYVVRYVDGLIDITYERIVDRQPNSWLAGCREL